MKEQIQKLVNESIDLNTWKRLQALIDEMHIKMETMIQLIEKGDYDQTYHYYYVISPYLVGIEEKFN